MSSVARFRLTAPAAFALVAVTDVAFLAASSAASPLYVVYQREWHFSSTVLTVVFAAYVAGLLGALLVVGSLSDYLGRRPVLVGGIGLESLALVLFLAADGVVGLAVARVTQGIATGAAITTLSAALVDLAPPDAPGRAGLVNGVAPLVGLAAGALGSGALIQLAPTPTRLVYATLLGGMVLLGLAATRLPETASAKPGVLASLCPRIGVPAQRRAEVLALAPTLVANWALGGLYLSLGPSVTASLLNLRSHLCGGLAVTLLCGPGALTAYALRDTATMRVLQIAAALLAIGMAITLAGVQRHLAVLSAVGTAVAGVGFGATALGSFGTLARISTPTQRGELFSAAYLISYLAFSLPALAAGFAASAVGLHATAMIYGMVVIALSITALPAQARLSSPSHRRDGLRPFSGSETLKACQNASVSQAAPPERVRPLPSRTRAVCSPAGEES